MKYFKSVDITYLYINRKQKKKSTWIATTTFSSKIYIYYITTMFTTKQNWGNISVISPLSQSNAVKARLKLFKHRLCYTFESVYTWIWGGQGKEVVSWKGKMVSPRTCFKGWIGRKGRQEFRCFLWTFILAKTKVSDNRQVKNENLNIKYT